jgi:hypothetical protein
MSHPSHTFLLIILIILCGGWKLLISFLCKTFSRLSRFHGGDYEGGSLLGCSLAGQFVFKYSRQYKVTAKFILLCLCIYKFCNSSIYNKGSCMMQR